MTNTLCDATCGNGRKCDVMRLSPCMWQGTWNGVKVMRPYWIDLRRSFARASFFSRTRPERQWRKLYPAIKRTNQKFRCQGFAVFIACSKRISYCKRRTLRTRLQPVCANLPAGCSGAWNSSECSQLQCTELKLWTLSHNPKLCTVTQRTLKNHRTVKIDGWVLARDNTKSIASCT